MLSQQGGIVMSFFSGGQEDSRASLSVRDGIMVLERNAQVAAHVRQGGGTQTPNCACQSDGAKVAVRSGRDAGASATGTQYGTIERGVVRGNELRALQHAGNLGPQLSKRRFVLHIPPGNAVNIGKLKIRPWRPDEAAPRKSE